MEELWFWIVLVGFIFSLLIALIIVYGRDLLKALDRFSSYLRYFIYRNDSCFEIVFLFLFTIEQIVLGSLIILYVHKANLILTVIIPIILGTASLRHIISNIKRRASEIETRIFYQEHNKWLDEIKYLMKEIEKKR